MITPPSAYLYDQSSPQIYGLILRMIGHPQTAEEVMLDVDTHVWKQAHGYDPHRGTPMAWLITLARTRTIDRLRAGCLERANMAALEEAELMPSNGASLQDQSAGHERRQIIQQALTGLAAEQREALYLAYYGGTARMRFRRNSGCRRVRSKPGCDWA